MAFQVVIDKRALAEIQKAINYYDNQQAGLSKKFNADLDLHLL